MAAYTALRRNVRLCGGTFDRDGNFRPLDIGGTRAFGAWAIHRFDQNPAAGYPCRTYALLHHGTTMLEWTILDDGTADLNYTGTGWGTVSDQRGVNAALQTLGAPLRFDRDGRGGGPRYTGLDGPACAPWHERNLPGLPSALRARTAV